MEGRLSISTEGDYMKLAAGQTRAELDSLAHGRMLVTSTPV